MNTLNLEKCAENAIHFHANQLQPIPAMVAVGTYPEQTYQKLGTGHINRKGHREHPASHKYTNGNVKLVS